MADEICSMTATELAGRIRRGELSATEVMEAHLERIEAVNPRINAVVTLLPERAMEGARAADEVLARGLPVGPLHGLPVAHKDLALTRGIRTTFGSPIFADFVPETDALIVERLRAAGAVTVGKTNTPEFGAGSQTFNEVFGETLNPYDATKTSGGSSGGAAAALACGMLPIADGSDMGGSLRNPASFCNVVGLRPSPGRVPTWPDVAPHPLSVEGPMARTVEDVALVLSAIAGPDPRSPLSISEPGGTFARPLDRDFRGVRVAWSRDLGGLPVDVRVTGVVEGGRRVLEALGCAVDEAEPDLAGADEVFKILRAWRFELAYGELLKKHRGQMKDTVAWNIEEGARLSGPSVGWAERRRVELYHAAREFMDAYEFLVLPVAQVLPFDVGLRYPTEIDGVEMETYIDWMKSCYLVTVMGLPAISVPCGFTPEGLPVGLQIVGRPRDDLGVLRLAHAFESVTGHGKRRPPVVN
ncbi:amidase [Rubrobacter marinus]|uniref:Amidase n=2 Tax=Rubrobacter marinus TaxID=2653852 RepID=A0A6G8PWI1_9ACTN|nr:amidase [Rubrobacter marinus]QIN78562.1 amidase [Rubrobacter marinus]